ncbi:IS1595 family transposase [Candidatus Spongiihabitans sp.]|uniref:IS1595 family transposase n=1 Tax=Candidatus Spongiihabitans sp. TaxID=3101308 RepID=UPI003C7047C3
MQHANLAGHIEVDESYFGAPAHSWQTQTGAGGKTIVFGLFKRNGWICTEIVPNARKSTLQAVIRGKINLYSVIYSDGWRGCHGLVDVGYAQHFRVEHGCDGFANEHSHINGIESFQAYAKLRLSKSKWIHKPRFYYPLKETEFRFTHRRDNLYHVILKLRREKPI